MTFTELAAHAPAPPLAAPADPGGPRRFDFRQQHRLTREAVRSLEVAHELFARRIASAWGSGLRTLVQVEPLAIDQVSYDAYIRSMPNPNVLAVVGVPGLTGHAVVELNPELAIVLVDRLLGGRAAGGEPVVAAPRRPTELESVLLTDLLGDAVTALDETLSPVSDGQAALQTVEYNPQLVQVAAPSDPVVLLSFRLRLSQGMGSEGLLTVCYPRALLAPVVEHLTSLGSAEQRPADPDAEASAQRAVVQQVENVDVTMHVGLSASLLPARALAGLQVGDVIRLDHRTGEPVRGRVGEVTVIEGHIGRRGRRLAVQVARWLATPAAGVPSDLRPPPEEFPQ